MRILMLLRNPFTRDARVLREARSLAAAGHEVTVLALRVGDLPAREARDGFQVVRGVAVGSWAGPTIAGASASSDAAGAGAPTGGGRKRYRSASAVILRDLVLDRMIARAASQIGSDVIHAHDLNTLGAGARTAAKRGALLVYDAHELYPDLTGLSRIERSRWRRVESKLIRRAALVIAPTGSRAEILAERYPGCEPIVVMNCPDRPPPELRDDRLAALRRPGERLVVYAGGFTPNRGLAQVVRAVGSLDRTRLAMLGWGPLEGELRAAAAPFGDRVVFVGAVEPDLVVPACSRADLGLVPYEPVGLNNQLAAPNKLFEYLHAGLAVCGSDLPDIRTVIHEHRVGEVFDASNERSIRDAVSRVLGDPDFDAMRQRARAAAANYTWDSQAKTLVEAYAQLDAARA